MGAGLPSAMAAKMVHPDRKVMAICGDGGFMMNSQELETAVRLKLDLLVLILNDNAYGMIKWKQAYMGFDNFGLDLKNPNFIQYAESYGAIGHRPRSCIEFCDMLENCLKQDGVHVIDLPVDYTIIYEGLDLTGINPEDVDFYYFSQNGALVKAEYDRLEVNIATGRLFVLDAKLPHFSRYGFVN